MEINGYLVWSRFVSVLEAISYDERHRLRCWLDYSFRTAVQSRERWLTMVASTIRTPLPSIDETRVVSEFRHVSDGGQVALKIIAHAAPRSCINHAQLPSKESELRHIEKMLILCYCSKTRNSSECEPLRPWIYYVHLATISGPQIFLVPDIVGWFALYGIKTRSMFGPHRFGLRMNQRWFAKSCLSAIMNRYQSFGVGSWNRSLLSLGNGALPNDLKRLEMREQFSGTQGLSELLKRCFVS